jgi:dGTP triphosphohydrolase
MRTHSERNADAMQLKESKVKEIKENEIKESKVNEDSHNAIFRKLWNNNIWLEGLAITWKADLTEIKNHLNTFRQECILKDEFKENEKVAKEHFFNWVKRGNPVPKKESKSKNVFDEIYEDLQKQKHLNNE